MRRLLSIGALAAASLSAIWQPALAQQVSLTTVGSRGGSRVYVFHGRPYTRRVWISPHWRRGRFIPGHWRYFR
jgi:hypothetical protein